MKPQRQDANTRTTLLTLGFAIFAGTVCSQSPNPNSIALAQPKTNSKPTNSKFILDAPQTLSSTKAKAASEPEMASHPFVYKADKPLKFVALVGSFNNWNKALNPMRVDEDGLTWRLTLPLKYGRYVYKFATFGPNDEENWIVDPNAPLDPNDKVNDNSLLFVAPADYRTPASPSDGMTARSALRGLTGRREIGYDAGQVMVSLRARPGDLRSISLKAAGKTFPMRVVRTDDLYAYYQGAAPWNRAQNFAYHFELRDGNKTQRFGADGLGARTRPFVIQAKTFQPYLLTESTQPLKMNGPLTTQRVAGPSWAKNLPIYEVNLDVYKFPKGTAIREFEKHLPVLKEMGVGLVWFMPLHPRGEKKGFGSPYAVRDYADINPDLGTKADFKRLVERAHELKLRVLMDWVPNHTSWDNAFVDEHPEWYVRNERGEIQQAQTWADVAQLDYGLNGNWNRPLWNQMRDDMTMWVRDYGVDGFRADVAGTNGRVPIEFWRWLRPQLDAIKPVFMLAEADNAEVHSAFDMSYSWTLPPVLWDISAGRKPASAIDETLRQEARKFPDGSVMMRFLDNHDWHPHADWGWGKGPIVDTSKGLPEVAPLMLLCATLPGKPLIYNGQEMSFLKTLPPAEAAARTQSKVWPFYKELLELYQSQPAIFEGNFAKIASDNDEKIYAFTRQHGKNRVVVVVNLTDQAQAATLKGSALAGEYRDWFARSDVKLVASPSLKLAPWGYRVYISRVG